MKNYQIKVFPTKYYGISVTIDTDGYAWIQDDNGNDEYVGRGGYPTEQEIDDFRDAVYKG